MTDSYEIGYGKPPKNTQFKKGRSGNPAGRPKKYKSPISVLEEAVTMKVNGKKREVTAFEASFRKTTQRALEGRLREIKRVFKACDEAGLLNPNANKVHTGVLYAPVDGHLLNHPDITDEQRAELEEIDRTRNIPKTGGEKTEHHQIIERVVMERHFLPSLGRKMTVFELIQHRLRQRAYTEGDSACHAFLEDLLRRTTVDVDSTEYGCLYVPCPLPAWTIDYGPFEVINILVED